MLYLAAFKSFFNSSFFIVASLLKNFQLELFIVASPLKNCSESSFEWL